MKDDGLASRAAAGDSSALEQLLRRNRQGILNLAFHLSGNREDAQEICQEAAIKIFRYISKFRAGKSFRSWAYAITLNAARDYLRRRKRQEWSPDARRIEDIGDERGNPLSGIIHREMGERLRQCLRRLTEKERTIFVLRDGEGLSIKETIEVTGVSSSSIRTHLSRARRKIREEFVRLEREGVER